MGIEHSVVGDYLQKWGIPRRSRRGSEMISRIKFKQLSLQNLTNLYLIQKLEVFRIAQIMGCSLGTVYFYLHKYGIPLFRDYKVKNAKLSKVMTGRKRSRAERIKISLATGGNGILDQKGKYPPTFNDKLKSRVLKLWGYECQACGTSKNLCVHHIDYNKYNNCLVNLIPLCRKCHTHTNYHRLDFKYGYQSILGISNCGSECCCA